MKLNSMKVDSSVIESGGWMRKLPQMGDLGLKVRGFGNTEDTQIQKEFIESLPIADRSEGLSAENEREMNTRRMLAALQDWENVTDDDGKLMPFSKQLAEEILRNRDFMVFRDAVWFACSMIGRRRADLEVAATKN